MKRILLIIILITSGLSNITAQTNQEVQFEQNLSWKQVLEKAQLVHKYIFVDCFATWCGPCKLMDNNIYKDSKIGQLMNEKFISVKLQMDKTASDDQETKSWFPTAEDFANTYQIRAYPTFLFFTPEGILVHKGLGYQNLDDFLTLAENSLKHQSQYITRFEAFKHGRLAFEDMAALAREAKKLQDTATSNQVAKIYEKKYLFKLSKSRLFTKDHLNFMADFMTSTKGTDFILFTANAHKIDSLTFPGMAERKMILLISQEEVVPEIFGIKPDWNNMEKRYTLKYGKTGRIAVLQEAFIATWKAKDWSAFGKAYNDYYDQAGEFNIWNYNTFAWDVFLHVTDATVLNKAAEEMGQHKEENIYSMDTYANLLYKSGRKEQAILWEGRAADMEQTNAEKQKRKPDSVYVETIKKMQQSLPTWTNNSN